MYGPALLLVVIGLALGGSSVDEAHQSPHSQVIEITCEAGGTRVTRSLGIARADGILMRFTHGPGEWVMTWEGAPGHSTSSGSAHTAELVWPLPPGGARVLCHPADLPPDQDPYHDGRWWVGVRVRDPHGFHLSPSADCATWMGSSWHGDPLATDDEESAAWEALDLMGVQRRPDDMLARTGYPEARPGQWALWRAGEPVAGVVMALRPDGRAQAAQLGACTDHVERQRSTS